MSKARHSVLKLCMTSLVLSALVTGCSTAPEMLSATPDNVSYRVKGDQVAQATDRAARFCNGFDKTARLQRVVNDGGQVVASYECD
jgi:hypothetical protein